MTTKADQLKEKQDRIRKAQAAAEAAQHPAPGPVLAAEPTQPAKSVPRVRNAPAVTKPLVKDVRLTVDLSPARYRDLQGWLNDAAVQLGRSRVTKQDALDALVGLLLRDDVTARKVLAEIRDAQ